MFSHVVFFVSVSLLTIFVYVLSLALAVDQKFKHIAVMCKRSSRNFRCAACGIYMLWSSISFAVLAWICVSERAL